MGLYSKRAPDEKDWNEWNDLSSFVLKSTFGQWWGCHGQAFLATVPRTLGMNAFYPFLWSYYAHSPIYRVNFNDGKIWMCW